MKASLLMKFIKSLSGRLFLLTIVFVMLAEILIFIPSFSRYRIDYLRMQMERAEIAIQALSVSTPLPPAEADSIREQEVALLELMGLYEIIKYDPGNDVIIHLKRPILRVDVKTYDLSNNSPVQWMIDGLSSIFEDPLELMRLTQTDPVHKTRLAVTLPKADMLKGLTGYAVRILLLSLFISTLTSILIYFVVRRFVVTPIVNLVDQMAYYQKEPENPERIIQPSSHVSDIHDAQRALAALQNQVIEALDQKNRLAALGEAVAKINHDLRNILASAQLLADRLEESQEPMAQRIGFKLVRSLDRAVTLCTNSLIFGQLRENLPVKEPVNLVDIVSDVLESVNIHDDEEHIDIRVNVNQNLNFMSDSDYLYRILLNLVRNAHHAINQKADSSRVLIINADIETQEILVIHVSDSGGGMPEEAKNFLFQPFKGGVKRGGTGLGLSITKDLCKLLGGEVILSKTDEEGTIFEVRLPYERVTKRRKVEESSLFDDII